MGIKQPEQTSVTNYSTFPQPVLVIQWKSLISNSTERVIPIFLGASKLRVTGSSELRHCDFLVQSYEISLYVSDAQVRVCCLLVGIEEPPAQELFLGAVHFRSPEMESINAGQTDHSHSVITFSIESFSSAHSSFDFMHKKWNVCVGTRVHGAYRYSISRFFWFVLVCKFVM